ncbi:hypothetical protein [Streptomyces sp. NPDC045470]|uniref:hypothetical protein n=1 Tax=Streptomyces sp. NPDC045470 TaxID=3155469 RepID=UPI00340295AB
MEDEALTVDGRAGLAAALSGPYHLHAVAHGGDFGELFPFTTDRIGSLGGLRSMSMQVSPAPPPPQPTTAASGGSAHHRGLGRISPPP